MIKWREKCLRVDSPILDNQVIGNFYLRTSEIGKPDMVNPILDKPLLLIIHVIKYELLKNQ